MKEQPPQPDKFNWWLPICAVGGAILLLLVFFIIGKDVLYFFFLGPIASLVLLVLLIVSAVRRKLRRCLSLVLTLSLFLLVSVGLLENSGAIRRSLRWLLFSRQFKAQVLAQPLPPNGELKHFEWDGWGGGPVGDWTAYVVFDPTDSMALSAKSNSSGKVRGVPCNVDEVHSLERQWYSVTLSMNEWWESCGDK